jgi:hypothetical protein
LVKNTPLDDTSMTSLHYWRRQRSAALTQATRRFINNETTQKMLEKAGVPGRMSSAFHVRPGERGLHAEQFDRLKLLVRTVAHR